ncbi:hypothetical protein KAI87_14100 [Myxococcota bacterium]|nr:hypothetical protein [Myxococcota bacterium]
MEHAVVVAEQAESLCSAGFELRPEIEPPGRSRWISRLKKQIHAALRALIGLEPVLFAGCAPTLTSFRTHLKTTSALVALRDVAFEHLQYLPPPLGFGPLPERRRKKTHRLQHKAGRDPPPENT